MKLMIKPLVTLAFVMCSFSALSVEKAKYDVVKDKIEKTIGFTVLSVGDAPVPGLLQVATDKGLFYTSEDGKFLMQGRIFNIDAGMRNETEMALSKMRVDGVSDFSDSVIEFKAEDEEFVVNVFTDITCGYCRKLHNEMEQYNQKGITVRYLAFPRGGLQSQSYQDMVSVWCSKDQQEAMTVAKSGGKVEQSNCTNNIATQYEFGQRIGVSGTPNIILPDGSMVPGYQPANQLLTTLRNI